MYPGHVEHVDSTKFIVFWMIYDGAMAKQCYFSYLFIVFSYISCEFFACGASYSKYNSMNFSPAALQYSKYNSISFHRSENVSCNSRDLKLMS